MVQIKKIIYISTQGSNSLNPKKKYCNFKNNISYYEFQPILYHLLRFCFLVFTEPLKLPSGNALKSNELKTQ